MTLQTISRRALALVASVFLVPVAASGDDDAEKSWFPGEFSGNVAISSDYPFRGISQTDEEASLQGGLDVSFPITDEISVWAGSWASNVNFGDGDEAQLELDIYGGASLAIGDFGFDVIALYYDYPGSRGSLSYDYWEFGPSMSYDFGVAAASVNYMYSPNFFAGTNDGHAISGGIEVPVPDGVLPDWVSVGISANVGGQHIGRNDDFGTRDYTFWDAGGTISVFGIDVDLRYFDTDLDDTGCFGGTDLCDGRFVATIGKSL